MSDPRNIFNIAGPDAAFKRLERAIDRACKKAGLENNLSVAVHVSDVGTSVYVSGCDRQEYARRALAGLAGALGVNLTFTVVDDSGETVH